MRDKMQLPSFDVKYQNSNLRPTPYIWCFFFVSNLLWKVQGKRISENPQYWSQTVGVIFIDRTWAIDISSFTLDQVVIIIREK